MNNPYYTSNAYYFNLMALMLNQCAEMFMRMGIEADLRARGYQMILRYEDLQDELVPKWSAQVLEFRGRE